MTRVSIKRETVENMVRAVLVLLGMLVLGVVRVEAQTGVNQKLVEQLSAIHTPVGLSELQTIAGGQTALIQQLQTLRLSDNPMVARRAEALLVDNFSSNPSVAAALEEDAGHVARAGHAKLIAERLAEKDPADAQGKRNREKLLGALLRRAESDRKVANVLRARMHDKKLEIPAALQVDATRLSNKK